MPSLSEFRIELDNPCKSYFAGQTIIGRIIVHTVNEMPTQGVKVKLYGKAKVHWTEEEQVHENRDAGTGTEAAGNQQRSIGSTRTVTRTIEESQNLFEYEMFVYGDGRNTNTIPTGRNMFPFQYTLPLLDLPSSYVGEYGHVYYGMEATIKRSWKFDHHVKEKFTVNVVVDLNRDASAAEPVQRTASKNFCCLCCASGPVSFDIKLPKKGYVPGESVEPVVQLNNQSGRGINKVSLSLMQEAHFWAQGKGKTSTKHFSTQSGPGVDPGSSETWKPIMNIPVPPTKLGGCRIIDVEYFLIFELHTSGLSFNLKEKIMIMIGTIPFQSSFAELNSKPQPAFNYSSTNNYDQQYGVPGPQQPTAPLAPMLGYTDFPVPAYHDSCNFGPPMNANAGGNGNVQNANFVPQYPTYGFVRAVLPVEGLHPFSS